MNITKSFRPAMATLVLAIASFAPSVQAQDWAQPGAYMIIAGLNSFEHFQDTGEDFGFARPGGLPRQG